MIFKTRYLVFAVLLAASLIFSACGDLICVDTTGKIYNMEAKVISQDGASIKGAKFFFSGNGIPLYRQDGSFIGGNGILTDSLGKVNFHEYTRNYSSCESEPEFASLAPISIMVVEPQYDTLKVTLNQDDLEKSKLLNSVYVLPNFTLSLLNLGSETRH